MMVEVEQRRSGRLCWVTPIREANRICKRTDVLRLAHAHKFERRKSTLQFAPPEVGKGRPPKECVAMGRLANLPSALGARQRQSHRMRWRG